MFQMSAKPWTPAAELSQRGLQGATQALAAMDKKVNMPEDEGSSIFGDILPMLGAGIGAVVGGVPGAQVGSMLGGMGGKLAGGRNAAGFGGIISAATSSENLMKSLGGGQTPPSQGLAMQKFQEAQEQALPETANLEGFLQKGNYLNTNLFRR